MDEVVFDITYRYDTNGIIHVNVTNPLDHSSMFAAEVVEQQQDKRKMVETANNARSAVSTGVLDKKAERQAHTNLPKELSDDLIIARTKISPFIDSEEANNLLSLCDRIVETNGLDTVLLQALQNFKDKYSYLI